MIELLNIDCREYMKTCRDKQFDIAIVDPPFFKGFGDGDFYGTNVSGSGVRKPQYGKNAHWDNGIPTDEYHSELKRISKHQIVFGINYFTDFTGVPVGRIIWDKENDDSTFSNAEIASCSLITSVKIIRHKWCGFIQKDMKNKEIKIHPTQKPIGLYKRILQDYAKNDFSILDTHLGSFSSAIAAHYFGCDFVGCEIDKEYYSKGMERFKLCTAQSVLF